MEKTLIIMKPDAMQRGIVGEVLTRFEKTGLTIVACKMVAPDREHFHQHYEGISKLISRWGQDVYDIVLSQMTETPVIAIVLEGVEAVNHVRKIVGTTDPKNSPAGTIRGDYTHMTQEYSNSVGGTLPNIVHASGSQEEAKKEIALWFNDDEVYEYETPHQKVVLGKVVLDKPAIVNKK
jgi:nucleoside-diphosphate kinase